MKVVELKRNYKDTELFKLIENNKLYNHFSTIDLEDETFSSGKMVLVIIKDTRGLCYAREFIYDEFLDDIDISDFEDFVDFHPISLTERIEYDFEFLDGYRIE